MLILIVIAGMAGAASFTHVHDWTMHNAPAGTGSWFGWANAVISELTPTAAGIEIRRRKRSNKPVAYPMAVLIAAALLSLTAQVSQARPTISGWISSAVPALAVLALTKLILSSSSVTKEEPGCAETAPKPAATASTSPTTNAPVPVMKTTAGVSPELTAPTPETIDDLRPIPSGQLLMSARMTAFTHQKDTGSPITSGELATRMNIPPALAESLLDHLDGTTPPPVTEANGTIINGSRP
jgi:hypothetical protein